MWCILTEFKIVSNGTFSNVLTQPFEIIPPLDFLVLWYKFNLVLDSGTTFYFTLILNIFHIKIKVSLSISFLNNFNWMFFNIGSVPDSIRSNIWYWKVYLN